VLNKRIYISQKEHLANTPFKKDLGYTYKKIAKQRKFRKKILTDFFKNVYRTTDTVIIAEMYGKMALGYNISVNIVYRDTNYYYTKDYRGGNSLITRKDYLYKEDGSHTFDMQRQVKDSIRHELWNAEPLHYGTDCNEENPVFITVLYPGGYIEPLYVRCWLTPEQIKMRVKK
jgi:hypothetical protein